jgi:hypothetical protein
MYLLVCVGMRYVTKTHCCSFMLGTISHVDRLVEAEPLIHIDVRHEVTICHV